MGKYSVVGWEWLNAPQVKWDAADVLSKSSTRASNLCITYWVKEGVAAPSPLTFLNAGHIRYGIRSPKERCPDDGREHYHYYLELKKQQRYAAVKKWFNDKTIHIESRKKSAYCARNYCTAMYYSKKRKCAKLEYTAVFGDEHEEVGKMKTPGARTGWIDMYQLIRHSDCVPKFREVADAFPQFAIKFERCIKQSIATVRRERAAHDIERELHIICGDAGTGKDETVYQLHDPSEIYELTPDEQGNIWWDGYEGQDVLLISDFKWWLTRTRLLTITGNRPVRVGTKGGNETWTGTKVYITSNYPVEEWYPDQWKGTIDPAFASRTDTYKWYSCEDEEYEHGGMPTMEIIKRPNYRARRKNGRRKKKKGRGLQYYPPTS